MIHAHAETAIKNTWLVLHQNGGRIGSVELTVNNLEVLNRQFCLSLIQTDSTGTQHYNVLGVRKPKKSTI